MRLGKEGQGMDRLGTFWYGRVGLVWRGNKWQGMLWCGRERQVWIGADRSGVER